METTEYWSEGKGHTDFLKAHSFFFPWGGRKRVFFICECVTLTKEPGAMCVPVEHPSFH